jgi:hypothetical protein
MGATSNALSNDLLRVLAMEATMQEMAAMDTSTISRAEKIQGRKIRQSRMPNRTIWFPMR